MASSSNQAARLIKCTSCYGNLNIQSRTFPCHHSFCQSCLYRNKNKGQTGRENDICPKCKESIGFDQLSKKPLRCQQLETTTEWKCDLCSDDGIKSVAKNWCHECQKLLCNNCSRFHMKFHPGHKPRDLDEMEMNEKMHLKTKDCLSDTCYESQPSDSPACSPWPLSVRGDGFKQKSPGTTPLVKEMNDLEMSLRKQIEKARRFTAELIAECDSECEQIWEEYEELKENARQRREELCEEVRQITNEQVEKWRRLLEENERILKQLEMWRRNLLGKSQDGKGVACDLQTLRSKLSSELQKPPIEPGEKCHLMVRFSNWWPQLLQQLKVERIGSVSLTVGNLPAAKNIGTEKQWNLLGLNLDIRSIQVSKEDNHVFLCEWHGKSIMEFNDGGTFVDEFVLDEGSQGSLVHPWDFCLISPNTLVVLICGLWGGNCELMFLERRKHPPFLEIEDIIETGRVISNFPSSLCHTNDTIFICDEYLNIDAFTKVGQKIKTFKIDRSGDSYCPRIRADPSGNLWLTKDKDSSSGLFYFNRKEQQIQCVQIKEVILDFCFNETGNIYFCNLEGIYSFYPEQKILYKFEKKSEVHPKLFALENEIFVYLRIDGKDSIKIFKI